MKPFDDLPFVILIGARKLSSAGSLVQQPYDLVFFDKPYLGRLSRTD